MMPKVSKTETPLSSESWRQRINVLNRELRELQTSLAALNDPEAARAAARGDAKAEARLLEIEHERTAINESIAAKKSVLQAAAEELQAAHDREESERRVAEYDAAVKLSKEVQVIAATVVDYAQAAAGAAHEYFQRAVELSSTPALAGTAPDPERLLDRIRAVLQAHLGVYGIPGYIPSGDVGLYFENGAL